MNFLVGSTYLSPSDFPKHHEDVLQYVSHFISREGLPEHKVGYCVSFKLELPRYLLSTSMHKDPVFGDFYQEFRIKAESVPLLPWRWRWADVRVSLSRSSKGFPCKTNLHFSAPSGLAQFKWGEAGRLLGRDPYVREQLLPLPTRSSKYCHSLSGICAFPEVWRAHY